jgi:hypothetical protein
LSIFLNISQSKEIEEVIKRHRLSLAHFLPKTGWLSVGRKHVVQGDLYATPREKKEGQLVNGAPFFPAPPFSSVGKNRGSITS